MCAEAEALRQKLVFLVVSTLGHPGPRIWGIDDPAAPTMLGSAKTDTVWPLVYGAPPVVASGVLDG